MRKRTRALVLSALMAALMAVLAPLGIPLGPIPLTLGVFMVVLTAVLLPLPSALVAVGLYVLLGVLGLPVFSGYSAGPQVLLGPTGGYLVGYFWLVAAVGLPVHRKLHPVWQGTFALAGLVVFHAVGLGWYMAQTGLSLRAALAVCTVPFALPDLLKTAAALGVGQVIAARLKSRG